MLPNEEQCKIHRDRALRLYDECRMQEAVNELAQAIGHSVRDAKSWRLLAQIYAAAGFHEQAASYAQKAVREDYEHMGGWVILANIYAQLGGPYFELAMDQIELAKAIQEDNPHLLYLEGSIRAQRGQTQEAIELLRRCLERYPKHRYAAHDLAALGG